LYIYFFNGSKFTFCLKSFGVSDNDHLSYDITDDATGDPHVYAQAQLPIYVNEVGHDQSITQNVLPRDKENGAVHYFFHAVEPLQKGVTVELFVNYLDKYEMVRERKGYGLNNLKFGLKNDSHLPSRYYRNLLERKETLKYISSFNIHDIKDAIQFIQSWIFVRVEEKNYSFMNMLKNSMLSSISKEQFDQFKIQIIARRRISWLSKNIACRLTILRNESKMLFTRKGSCIPSIEEMLNNDQDFYGKIIDSLKMTQWNVPSTIFNENDAIAEAYMQELSEEFLLDISGRIYEPFNQSLWAPATSNLLQKIIKFLALFFDETSQEIDSFGIQKIYEWAKKSFFEVNSVCRDFFSLQAKAQKGCESSISKLDIICLTSPESNTRYILSKSENWTQPHKTDVMVSNEFPFEKIYKLQCVHVVHAAMTTFFEKCSNKQLATDDPVSYNGSNNRKTARAFSNYCDWLDAADKTQYPFGYSLAYVCAVAGISLLDAKLFLKHEENVRLSSSR